MVTPHPGKPCLIRAQPLAHEPHALSPRCDGCVVGRAAGAADCVHEGRAGFLGRMVLARGAANIADQFFGWYPRGWDGGFLAPLHSPWGYDEPEILRYSNRQFGPIGADAGHSSLR